MISVHPEMAYFIVAIASMFVIFHRWHDYENGHEAKRL